MTQLLLSGSEGIPLTLLAANDYNDWLNGQDKPVQNWLGSTQYKGKGLSLIPGTDGSLSQVLYVSDDKDSHWVCGDLVNELPAGQYLLEADTQTCKLAAFSWALGAYKFDRYKANDKVYPQLVLRDAELVEQTLKMARSVSIVRDLVNTPAADMMPQHLGETMESLASEFGAKVTQIVGDDLLTHNYPTIHMVGRASHNAPRLIDLTWGDEDAPKVTLVGKGVCFDSGGLDLKPGAGMRLMKKDMGGAAHVIGLAHQIMAAEQIGRAHV